MEDNLIVESVLQFEKIYALESDYNCLIVDKNIKNKEDFTA